MIPEVSLHNLSVWIAQVFIVTSAGIVLPRVFRIEHPRSKLVYYRLLLIAALMLPLLQPIQHELVILSGSNSPAAAAVTSVVTQTGASTPAAPPWTMRDILIGILAAGLLVRLCCVAGGLWELRRLKNSSTTLYPVGPAIQRALRGAKAEALFCISETIKGPVTFGFARPVVLLPASFLDMPEEAQSSIACHELMHVRRKDWLLTMFEEFVTSVLWFQPAVWLVVAETRLAREQYVDATVVSLTDSRDSYINALFSLANAQLEVDISVAPLFLRRRHLTQRIHSLLTEVSMSRSRLLSSYSSMAAILAVVGWLTFASLPLTGEPEVRRAPAQAQPVQNSIGYVVNRAPLSYPVEAIQKRIEGTVVVEVAFNAKGEIVDSRVLSGPEELRQAGLQTALQGKYAIDVARTLQVVVDFKLPAPAPPARQGATSSASNAVSRLSGLVVDPSANLLPGVTITITNMDDPRATESVVLTGLKGEYGFAPGAPGTYKLTASLLGFEPQTYNGVKVGRGMQMQMNFTLRPEGAAGGPRGGGPRAGAAVPPLPPAPGGVRGEVAGAANAGLPFQKPARLRISGNIAAANLLQQVKPEYPQAAKDANLLGVVVLEAVINKEGKVEGVTVVSGQPLLAQVAMDAVAQWIYKPFMLNGEPVEAVTNLTLNLAAQN